MPVTVWLPLLAVLLVQPPVAAHELALVELQVSVDVPPLEIFVGLAVNVTVGCATTVTVAAALPEPLVPEQVIA